MSSGPQHVVVIGASLAGLSTARALRSQGFAGTMTVVGDELHRPYDRPPLSKEFLGSLDAKVELGLEGVAENLDATWRLGERAQNLSALPGGGARVVLSGGDAIEGDGIVIATGASARCTLPGVGLPGVHVLRTLDDAMALRADLHEAVADGRPVVVVGGGFIATEVAATARELGCCVTLLVPDDMPLRSVLGPFAEPIASLHREHGVTIRTHARVQEVRRAGASGLEVLMSNGDQELAGTVVLGVGAKPATAWLTGSGVTLDSAAKGAIRCDETGATDLPAVFAVGDCAVWFHPGLGYHYPIEHWTSAKERGAVVAARLLGAERLPISRPPYVWSDLYGKKLQLAGYRSLADHPDAVAQALEGGSLQDCSFTAVYRRAGEPVAVLALDQPRIFAGIRRRLVTPTLSHPSARPEGAPA